LTDRPTSATPVVIAFAKVGATDGALVGGKGANLGELARAGLPVPDGFCVTAAAYRRHLEITGLEQQIAAALASHDGESPDKLSEQIQGLIRSQAIPPELASAMVQAYAALPARGAACARVAVRSSATAEDLPDFSFAGQQDTYLGISGELPLLDAVRRCWASLWTPRAIAYRESHGFRHQDVYIAVVVQEMFPSEVSGVMFTVNPLTGNGRQAMVNASWGLGEAIVSGLVNPDYWIVDKRTLEIREERLGEKLVKIDQSPDGSGVEHREVDARDRTRASLSPELLAELVAVGAAIERHYGFPQDIEWGCVAGRIAILQSREVTGVEIDFGEDLDRWNREEPDDEEIVWTRAWADAFQTAPTTPLMYTVQQKVIARSYDDMYKLYGLNSFLKRRLYRWHRTRPYHSTTYERARLQLMPKFARTDQSLIFFPPADREAIRRLPFQWWKVVYGQLHALLTQPRYSFWRCADTFYKEYPAQVERYRKAISFDFATASVERLLKAFDETEECFIDHARSTTPGIMDYCYFLILGLSELLRRWANDHDQSKYAALLSGLPTKTVQENAEIWRIASRIRTSPVLRQAFAEQDPSAILRRLETSTEGGRYLAEIRSYIAENGHRGGSERDLAFPRWRHRPELFINALRSLASGDASSDPELLEKRMVERREATTAQIIRDLRAGAGGFLKARVFSTILRWALKYVQFRDDQRYYCDYYMTIRHDIFLAVGDRLCERSLLGSRDEIFFLGLEEIQDLWAGKMKARDAARRIKLRREQHQKYARTTPPFFIRAGLPVSTEEEDESAQQLLGIAASPGKVRARARVCKTLEDAGLLEKGDILVAAATDPGWTPVFSIIAGVVVETGGPLAHATLVSREYGIPCVTTVSRATERIRDREFITVDGYAGRVLLEQSQEDA
jgi:pyruvate,water dikinase